MSLVAFRHTLSQRDIGAGADEVLTGCPMPPESRLIGSWGEVHAIKTTVSAGMDIDKAAMYACDGWVVLVEDPDTSKTYGTVWNNMVPKDQDMASGAFDLDTSAGANDNYFEPGEPSLEAILDAANVDKDAHFFKRRKLISYASMPRAFDSAASPDSYYPMDVFPINTIPRIGVSHYSVALLGFASPGMDDTNQLDYDTPDSEAKWIQLQYLEVVLEQAWMYMVGLVEVGAETPYEDAALFIEDFLEPTVSEESTGQFQAITYVIFTKATWGLVVPGRRQFKSVSAEM